MNFLEQGKGDAKNNRFMQLYQHTDAEVMNAERLQEMSDGDMYSFFDGMKRFQDDAKKPDFSDYVDEIPPELNGKMSPCEIATECQGGSVVQATKFMEDFQNKYDGDTYTTKTIYDDSISFRDEFFQLKMYQIESTKRVL